jgi:hypothetical protein
MTGDPLCYLQGSSVFKIVRNAGCTARMGGIIAHDACIPQSSLQEISSSNLVIGRDPSSRLLPSVVGNSDASGFSRSFETLRYSSRISSNLWWTGISFSFPPFSLKDQRSLPGLKVILDLQIHDGADPGESVGKDPEQSAIAQAGVRGPVDGVKKRLNLAFDECRRFPFGARESLGLDFPGRIHGQHSLFR